MTGIESNRNYADNDEAINRIRQSEMLDTAMVELALCYRDLILCPPAEGADLGTILIGSRFEGILRNHGLAIVPQIPTLQCVPPGVAVSSAHLVTATAQCCFPSGPRKGIASPPQSLKSSRFSTETTPCKIFELCAPLLLTVWARHPTKMFVHLDEQIQRFVG